LKGKNTGGRKYNRRKKQIFNHPRGRKGIFRESRVALCLHKGGKKRRKKIGKVRQVLIKCMGSFQAAEKGKKGGSYTKLETEKKKAVRVELGVTRTKGPEQAKAAGHNAGFKAIAKRPLAHTRKRGQGRKAFKRSAHKTLTRHKHCSCAIWCGGGKEKRTRRGGMIPRYAQGMGGP